jgi:hypothetical protein
MPNFTWSTGLEGVTLPGKNGPASVYELLIARREVEYRLFLFNLARRIAELQPRSLDDALLPLPYVPQIDGVPSAFDPPLPLQDIDQSRADGPHAVTFVYATPPVPKNWPFAPSADSAIARAAKIAKAKDMDLQAIEFNPADRTVVGRVRTARERNNVVVVMVDGGLLGDDRLCDSLRQLDASFEALRENVAAVVVWNQEPDEGRLSGVLPRFGRSEFYHGAVRTPAHLDRAISTSVSGLHNRLLQSAASARAATDAPPIARSTAYTSAPQF